MGINKETQQLHDVAQFRDITDAMDEDFIVQF